MSRPQHLEFAGALYHVTARGNAHEDIIRDDEQINGVSEASLLR